MTAPQSQVQGYKHSANKILTSNPPSNLPSFWGSLAPQLGVRLLSHHHCITSFKSLPQAAHRPWMPPKQSHWQKGIERGGLPPTQGGWHVKMPPSFGLAAFNCFDKAKGQGDGFFFLIHKEVVKSQCFDLFFLSVIIFLELPSELCTSKMTKRLSLSHHSEWCFAQTSQNSPEPWSKHCVLVTFKHPPRDHWATSKLYIHAQNLKGHEETQPRFQQHVCTIVEKYYTLLYHISHGDQVLPAPYHIIHIYPHEISWSRYRSARLLLPGPQWPSCGRFGTVKLSGFRESHRNMSVFNVQGFQFFWCS